MKLLLKYVLKNLEDNLGRTILIMLSLFIVSIIVSIIVFGLFFFKIIDNAVDDLNAIDFDYNIESLADDYLSSKIVNEINNEFNTLGVADFDYGYVLDEKKEYKSTVLGGFKIDKIQEFECITFDEKENVELFENEVIITTNLSKKYELKKGDEFEYYGRNGSKNILKVKYIVKPSKIFSNINIITNEQEFLKIIGNDEQHYQQLLAKYIGSAENKIENIEKLENKLGLKISESDKEEISIEKFVYPAVIIGILIFSIIFVSLNSIVKIIINERIPQIGTFRSIGATKKIVMSMLVLELLIYSVIPCLLGGVVGAAMLKGIESFLNMELNMFGIVEKIKIIKYIIPLTLITTTITILFQIALSISELLKVSKMSIKDTIFNRHISNYNYSVIKIIIGLLFFIIGIITLLKYKQLTFWYGLIGIISIFISIGLFVPVIMLIILKIFGRNKSPVIKMALNKIKTSSLQINTNIIFIVTISISLITFSFLNYMRIIEKTKINAVNSDLYVEEKNMYSDVIYDKTNEFYKIESVNSVSTLYDINITTNYIYDTIDFANNNIESLHMIYSNNYEQLLQDCELIKIDSNFAREFE